MRVVVIGFPNSVHITHHLALLDRREMDLHLIPSLSLPWAAEHHDVTLHQLDRAHPAPAGPDVRVVDHGDPDGGPLDPARRARLAAEVIRSVRPDLVHAQEFQAGGTLAAAAGEVLGAEMPPLLVSNWGSDIFWFARTPDGRDQVRHVLAAADALACESERDVGLALGLGFRGRVLPVQPIAGGLDLDHCAGCAMPGPVSQRTAVAVKGRETWAGRAALTLTVLRGCADLLAGRELILHSASPGVADAMAGLARDAGARLTVVENVEHVEVLRAFGRSRVALAVSVSDGIAQSTLEAMACGAFAVQTGTATVREWYVDGVGGLTIDASDHRGMVRAVRRALTDDALVDGAPAANREALRRRADRTTIARRTAAGYRHVCALGAMRA